MTKHITTCLALAALLSLTAAAQPNTALMQDARTLAFNHGPIQRAVEDVEGGIKAVTTTTDPELVPVLQRHVRAMHDHYTQGGVVRRWDPLFAELSKVSGAVDFTVVDVENGVEVLATSADPNVVLLIRAHAAKVTDFQQRGPGAMRETSPLPAGYTPVPGTVPVCTPQQPAAGAMGGRGMGQGQGRGMQSGRGTGYDAGMQRGGQGQGMGMGMGQGGGQRGGRGRGMGGGMGQRGAGVPQASCTQ